MLFVEVAIYQCVWKTDRVTDTISCVIVIIEEKSGAQKYFLHIVAACLY